MKKRQKQILVMLFALALMLTPMSVAWADTSSGEMQASDQKFEDVDGGKRIDKFTLDNKYNYQSLGNDSGKATFTLNASSIQNIVKDKLLPQWSGIAAGIFRDQSGQLVDLYGYKNNSACMTKEGFDAYFDRARSENGKYKDEKWSCYSLKNKLQQTSASRAGEQNWDQFIVSGVKQFSNLAGARKMMGQQLHDIHKSNPITADDFLDVEENGESRLGSLDDDSATTGFANIVTATNCKGSSNEFDYVSFGIAFYDFEPVPVAANHLKYHTFDPSKSENTPPATSSEITNGQQQDIVHSALLGDSVTETTSTTMSGLASFNMSQNIGANISMSETETSSTTDFWSDDTFGTGMGTESSSSSTSMGMNWGAAWEMGGAMGAEMGHSTSKEVSKAVETSISLPPHTATNINHAKTTTTYTQNYQQPVILNYKVALFAMSGDFSAAGAGGINSDSLYDKQSLVIKFDTKDDDSPSFGCAATDDLYSRVITNSSVKNYDSSGERTFESHSTASGFKALEGITWNDVKSYAGNVPDVAKTNYFYETPGKISIEQDKMSSNVGEIYPLHDLASVKTPKTTFVLSSKDTLNREKLPLEGYNEYNVPFYGFDSDWGEWNRCNENGEIINGGYLLDDDPVEFASDEETLVPKTNKYDTIYITWKCIEGKTKKTGDSPEGQDLANSNIKTPVVKIKVVNSSMDKPNVAAEGEYIGYYKKPINLNDVMKSEVTDENDKLLTTQVYWEAREEALENIIVDKNTGDVTFTEPGTYHVRPYVINNDNEHVFQTDQGKPKWLTVTAIEHDLAHYDKKDPTCTEIGIKEIYRCSDCGKYFSDAEGKNEVPEKDCIIKATGHDWGDWTTTKEASANKKGEQERVCKNDESHVEKRDLYSVQFNTNGHGVAPKRQTIPSGASVTVPQEPTDAGYMFDGWYKNKDCTEAYDFSETVKDNLTLYAKWTNAKYTTAAMAIGEVSEEDKGDGPELTFDPNAHGTIEIVDGEEATEEEEGYSYSYYYKEAEYGNTVTLKSKPDDDYKLGEIWAIPINSDSSVGEPFEPEKIDENTYSLTVPAADVAILANFVEKEHEWGEWKETTPATIGAEGEETRVCAKNNKHTETRSIDKVNPAPLNNAIKAAQDTQKGVKTSKDGKDVDPADMYTTAAEKKALYDAVAAGQKVVNNPKSTQKQVDDAVAAVKKAKETYDAAKKPGKKGSEKPKPGTDPNQKGKDGTAVGKGASAASAEKAILKAKGEKDLKGSKYAPLMLKSTKQTKKSVKLTWKKAKGAKTYVIYGTPCGKKNKYKKLKTLGASKKAFNVKKVAGKKLKKKTYYKFILVALDSNRKVVSTSKSAHAATKGSKKKANAKGVIVKAKVNKAGKKIKKWKKTSKIALKAGSTPKALVKSTKLKAKDKKAKKTKIEKHIAMRFESSNPNVVKVNKKGKLTAKKKGKAKIYVIAQNGIAKTVKVTVK